MRNRLRKSTHAANARHNLRIRQCANFTNPFVASPSYFGMAVQFNKGYRLRCSSVGLANSAARWVEAIRHAAVGTKATEDSS